LSSLILQGLKGNIILRGFTAAQALITPTVSESNIYGPTKAAISGPNSPAIFYIKQNDTLPVLHCILQDVSGAAVDLTGAEVRFHMRDPHSLATAAAISADCVIDDALNGKVSYHWASGDTALASDYLADIRVIFADGSKISFPNNTEFSIHIEGAVSTP
jgi:hypothetical protein